MLQVDNRTPFEACLMPFPDEQGIDALYGVFKASFRLTDLAPLEEQVPIRMADEYWGEPGVSSVRFGGEAHLSKPTTDVVLVGSAWAPAGQQRSEMAVRLRVGPVERSARVVGDRRWKGGLLGASLTEPEPFESMPLTWERTFGGVHVLDEAKQKRKGVPMNPAGAGFRGKRRGSELEALPVPNVEDPASPYARKGDRTRTHGFGFVAPHWQPRLQYAGTYDEAWQKSRAPFLPDDFDPRFFLQAPEGLSTPRPLEGGEPVELEGLSPEGPLRFDLPRVEPRVEAQLGGRVESVPAQLETVLIEPDENRLLMTWRAKYSCDKRTLAVECMRFEAELGAAAAVGS